MKNIFKVLCLVIMFSVGTSAFSAELSDISGLTPSQTEQLKRIDFSYKQQFDTLEKRIQNYKDKIAEVKNDTEKSAEQKALLVGAYERNIEILKKQQKQAAEVADKSYRTTLTETQYQQFKDKRY